MAGTIISTPALGASDWSDFITQQERTDRGYMRLSLTNFSDTTASTIATGGVLECAGSIYQFTDTAITLATGTASADVAVYYHVIPSAGGTTCTVEMDDTAPTWVDAKQGFYASAASVTRVVGGCYVGSDGVYYTKWLYSPEMLQSYLLPMGQTRPLIRKMLELGEWDMDSDQQLLVAHGCGAYHRIRAIDQVLIRPDPGVSSDLYPLDFGDDYQDMEGTAWISGVNIAMRRLAGGHFDSASYNATAGTLANRGWIIFTVQG